MPNSLMQNWEIAKNLWNTFGNNPDNQKTVDSMKGMLGLLPAGAGDVASGLLAADDVRRGDYGSAALNGVGVLPFIPSMAGIVSPKVAKGLSHPTNLPADDIFTQAVKNTPGARVAEDGLYMNVMRGQKPEMGLMPSVRGGVFYLPEGAPQMKHYSTGKNGYGGTERITGETLIKNPLFVKGATGGKAPESAFDSLLGKGSYNSMRNDALKVYGGWNASKQQKYQLAEDFLDKYAPEMSGMGAYIVDNSGQGNQLAYALQEAAVASAARSAGHDAVVGYSKGKQGPFLSELFDVRESSYPDKFGGYSLWDE